MELVALRRARLAVCVLVCGAAVAVGWAVCGRLEYNGAALIPGALAGLAIALASGDERRLNRGPVLAAAGALGTGLSALIASRPVLDGVDTVAAGAVLALAAKGAVVGGVAGAALGMALSRTPYRMRDAAWLVPALAWWCFTGGRRWRDTGAPGDLSLELALALLVGIVWLAAFKRDRPAVFASLCGAAGFGAGLPLGAAAQLWGARAGAHVDWLFIGHGVCGFIGGGAIGLAAYIIEEDLVRPAEAGWDSAGRFALALVAWWLPFRTGYEAMAYWAYTCDVVPVAAVYAYVVLGVGLPAAAGAWLDRRATGAPATGVAAGLFVWVMGATFLLQALVVFFPTRVPGVDAWTTLAGAACCIALAAYALLRHLRRPGSAA
ncbi:MAG: hypothetical protein JXR94_02570 [Candidatus Hydrogenedentes bacterium]|nr:hypothetical protein [Candidatus Hydrogenedentota bacterium]